MLLLYTSLQKSPAYALNITEIYASDAKKVDFAGIHMFDKERRCYHNHHL